MSRHLFGLSPADIAMERVADALVIRPGAVGQIWDSIAGGTQITDLTDLTSNPITSIAADTNGTVGFYGPADGTSTLYVDFGFGRYLMQATDLGAQVDAISGVANSALQQSGGTVSGPLVVTGPLSAQGVTDWINVQEPVYGAAGDGLTDDTVAIQAAISAAQARGGGVVFFPEGTYLVTPTASPALSVTGNNVRLVGAGNKAATLKKSANGVLLAMSGPSTDTTGATHLKYCSIENLGLNGNSKTGLLLQLYYADNLVFRDLFATSNADMGIDAVELWDSRFYNLTMESCGSTTANASAPNVMLRNSAAASGFGFSSDSVNQLHFQGCRFENFTTGGLWIQQGSGNSNNPNGIYITDCKFETSQVKGGPHLQAVSASRHVFARNLYCYSGGFASGYSTSQNVIQWSAGNSSLEDVLIASGASATVNSGVDLFSGVGTACLRNIIGQYNASPTGVHVFFEGTSTSDFNLTNCVANTGTQFGGTIPVKWAGSSPIMMVAGPVSDGSFTHTPLDGTTALDTVNQRFYVRSGGTWQIVQLATVTTAVTATNTVANSAALAALQSATVPANDPVAGSVYEITGYGVYSVTGTPTLTFSVYWGGIAGTLIAQVPAVTAASGIASGTFSYTATVTFRSATSVTAVLNLNLGTSAATDLAATYVATPTAPTAVTSSGSNALAVGFKWSAASASNTLSLLGGTTQRIS